MENDEESEHEAELSKRNQQETRMFYLPIYNHVILCECFWNEYTKLSVVLVLPGIYRPLEIILKFTLITHMLPTLVLHPCATFQLSKETLGVFKMYS